MLAGPPFPPLRCRLAQAAPSPGQARRRCSWGGVVGALCPPGASCIAPAVTARDGAAYNPSTGSWRRMAPAPADLPEHPRASVVAGKVYQLVGSELLVYDATGDVWHRERGPIGPADGLWSLAEADGLLVALRTEQRKHFYPDQRYDPATRVWTALPRDPLVPMYDRDVAATPLGLVLTGRPEVDQPGRSSPPRWHGPPCSTSRPGPGGCCRRAISSTRTSPGRGDVWWHRHSRLLTADR